MKEAVTFLDTYFRVVAKLYACRERLISKFPLHYNLISWKKTLSQKADDVCGDTIFLRFSLMENDKLNCIKICRKRREV